MVTRLVVAALGVGALVLLAAWFLGLSLARAIVLAPVIVISAGAIAALLIFWTRVGWQSLRSTGHPRLILAGVLAFVGLIVVLTVLGVKLPRGE